MGSKTDEQSIDLCDLADAVLVERFQATGEVKYIEELWLKHAKGVHQSCLGFLRNYAAAEDVTANVFVKVMRNLRTEFRPDHFKGWLFTIAKHECVNHIKLAAERLHGGNVDGLVLAVADDPSLAIDIGGVLRQLSAPQRIALKLCYGHGYSYKEIAQLEGWTLDEVETHLQNGRRMFKKLWESRLTRKAT